MRKESNLFTIANGIVIKPYSLGELSKLYSVERRTLKRWLNPFKKEIGQLCGRYYTIRQVKIIFGKLDIPSVLMAKEHKAA